MRGSAILLLFLAVGACSAAPARIQLAVPQPSEAQLQTCPDPALVPDPAKASDTDLALERISVASWGACNKSRLDSLIDWCRKVLMGGK